MTPLQPQHPRGRSVPCRDTRAHSSTPTSAGIAGSGGILPCLIRRIKPLSDGEHCAEAGQPARIKHKARTNSAPGHAHLLSAVSGQRRGRPHRQRSKPIGLDQRRNGSAMTALNHSQRVSSAPHFLSATGAAVAAKPPLSSLCKLAGLRACLFSLALLSAPATADTCRYGPNTVATQVTIEPHETAFAVVHIQNKLAFRTERYCDLTIFGVTVTVEYDPGAGAIADWFRVTVPAGFVAVPAEILIDDRDEGQVLIVLEKGLGA